MTTDEFGEWIDHFGACFPEVREWLAKAGEATVAAWQRVIEPLALIDAKAAIDVLIDGKESIPKAYERSEWPATIKRIASRLFLQRNPAPERTNLPITGPRHSMVEMLACIRECAKQGMDAEAALLVLEKRFPVADEDQPRVRCLTCDDSGWVDVWDSCSVQCVIAKVPVKRYRGTMLCNCPSADRYQRRPEDLANNPSAQIIPRYDPRKFCRWEGGDLSKLNAWVEERRMNRTKEMPNYEPGFEEFA